MNFSKDLLSTQPWRLSIFKRMEDKVTPCWIRTNNLLTANEDLLPTELRDPEWEVLQKAAPMEMIGYGEHHSKDV